MTVISEPSLKEFLSSFLIPVVTEYLVTYPLISVISGAFLLILAFLQLIKATINSPRAPPD